MMARNNSFYCTSLHSPKTLSKHGCSYSVKVKNENLKQIYALVEKMGLKVYGVFKEVKDDNRINYVKVDMN